MKMKKTILLALLSLFAVNLASAQTKHTTMLETNRDTLYPEIVIDNWGWYEHFQHPATNLICFAGGDLCTSESYNTYLWETNPENMPIGGDLTAPEIYCAFHHSDYLKVTVWDTLGNSGTDSIWFNIKDFIDPMPDFTMELDSTNHAVFSGTATIDHRAFQYFRSLDTTLSWPQGSGYHELRPGYWRIRDDDVWFTSDSIWNYKLILVDTCGYYYEQEMLPGMVMGTQPAPGGGWYLTMKSVMQSNKKALGGRDWEEYVYALYTVDHDGVRHPFEVDGEQVVLPTSTQAYLLPGRHPDAYYQGGIGKLTGGKDGGMEVLSYSNKVENPLPDLDDVGDLNGDGTNATGLKVWPNPNNGTFTVEGEGRLKVFNLIGQAVIDRDLDGKTTMTLPRGVYIMKLNGQTAKLVVE
jgi:hypothetical protein